MINDTISIPAFIGSKGVAVSYKVEFGTGILMLAAQKPGTGNSWNDILTTTISAQPGVSGTFLVPSQPSPVRVSVLGTGTLEATVRANTK